MVVVGYLIVARNTFTIRLPNYARLLVHKIGYIFFNQKAMDAGGRIGYEMARMA